MIKISNTRAGRQSLQTASSSRPGKRRSMSGSQPTSNALDQHLRRPERTERELHLPPFLEGEACVRWCSRSCVVGRGWVGSEAQGPPTDLRPQERSHAVSLSGSEG